MRGSAQHHGPLERGQVLALQQLDVVRPEKLAHRTQNPGTALAEHVAGFSSLQAGVERHEDSPRRLKTDGGHNPLMDVGRPNRHPIAGLDAGSTKGPGGLHPRLRQLGKGQVHLTVFDRAPLCKALRSRLHESWNRRLYGLRDPHSIVSYLKGVLGSKRLEGAKAATG